VIRRVFGARIEYGLRAIDYARQRIVDEADRVHLLEVACGMTAAECVELAGSLARMGREDEAAAQYERAFDDPSYDAVRRSNASWWLVNYYFRPKRSDEALTLASESAEVGSWQGLLTLAYLYERLGQPHEAEPLYVEGAERYDNPSQLFGFYYRTVHNRKQMEFEKGWKDVAAQGIP